MSPLLLQFNLQQAALFNDIGGNAAMGLCRRPNGFTELVRLHLSAALSVLLEPGAWIEVNDDAIWMSMQRCCFAASDCRLQYPDPVILERDIVHVRRNTDWI